MKILKYIKHLFKKNKLHSCPVGFEKYAIVPSEYESKLPPINKIAILTEVGSDGFSENIHCLNTEFTNKKFFFNKIFSKLGLAERKYNVTIHDANEIYRIFGSNSPVNEIRKILEDENRPH